MEEKFPKRQKTEGIQKRSPREQLETAIVNNDVSAVRELIPLVELSRADIVSAKGKQDILQLLISLPDISMQNYIFGVVSNFPDKITEISDKLRNDYNLPLDVIAQAYLAALFTAIIRNDTATINHFLNFSQFHLIDTKDSEGNTPLHIACSVVNIDALTNLVSRNAKLNERNMEGNTPLHVAAKSAAISHELVLAGADLSIKNNYGETPLLHALRSEGDISNLVSEAQVNEKNDKGQVPILMAAQRGSASAVTALLTAKTINLDVTNDLGENALFIAAKKGNFDAFKLLWETNKFDLSATTRGGFNLLHYALIGDNEPIIDLIIQSGHINKFLQSSSEVPHPLSLVKNDNILRKLLEVVKPEVLQQKDIFGLSILDWLSMQVQNEKLKPILQESNIKDEPLATNQMRKQIRTQLQKSPDKFCLGGESENPDLKKLFSSIYFMNPLYKELFGEEIKNVLTNLYKHNIMFPFLELQSKIIEGQYDERFLLRIVSDYSFEKMYMEFFSSADQTKNILTSIRSIKGLVNSSLQNFLHLAVIKNDKEIVKVMVESGVKINGQDNKGFTPLDYSQDPEITNYLTEKGAKKGSNILKESGQKMHLTILTPYGSNLKNFPINASDKESGLYAGARSVYVGVEEADLIPSIIHEWAHRFVKLLNIDLGTPLEKYFKIVEAQGQKFTTNGDVEEDCKKTLLGLLHYDKEKRLEEFFVRTMEIIAKYGDKAVTFLEKNFSKEMLDNIGNVLANKFSKREPTIFESVDELFKAKKILLTSKSVLFFAPASEPKSASETKVNETPNHKPQNKI